MYDANTVEGCKFSSQINIKASIKRQLTGTKSKCDKKGFKPGIPGTFKFVREKTKANATGMYGFWITATLDWKSAAKSNESILGVTKPLFDSQEGAGWIQPLMHRWFYIDDTDLAKKYYDPLHFRSSFSPPLVHGTPDEKDGIADHCAGYTLWTDYSGDIQWETMWLSLLAYNLWKVRTKLAESNLETQTALAELAKELKAIPTREKNGAPFKKTFKENPAYQNLYALQRPDAAAMCPATPTNAKSRAIRWCGQWWKLKLDKWSLAANEFEWGGIFAVADSSHKWLMHKVGGKYVDPSMRLVIFPIETKKKKPTATLTILDPNSTPINKTTLEAHKAKGNKLMKDTCTDIQDKGTIKPIAKGSCFNLVMGAGDDSSYTIDTTGLTGIVVFAQHVHFNILAEFDPHMHYLKNSAGKDVKPTAQDDGDEVDINEVKEQ